MSSSQTGQPLAPQLSQRLAAKQNIYVIELQARIFWEKQGNPSPTSTSPMGGFGRVESPQSRGRISCCCDLPARAPDE